MGVSSLVRDKYGGVLLWSYPSGRVMCFEGVGARSLLQHLHAL
jgi:hypothetical protein